MFRLLLKSALLLFAVCIGTTKPLQADNVIPFNEESWEFKAKAFVLENYRGKDAIYIQQGAALLKDTQFLNGTIEFDVFLTPRQSFPGVYFRLFDKQNGESFFLRPHLSGKPDANQAAPTINGLVAWQLYFGETYSFNYTYNFDDWTHVKLLVKDQRAQVFLDYSDKPHLSWILKHEPKAGKVSIGGGFAPMHYANFTISHETPELKDFAIKQKPKIAGIIPTWRISDKFDEARLDDLTLLGQLIKERQWPSTVRAEETNVANISWAVSRYEGDGNTVFAKLIVNSAEAVTRIFDFGYSDRAVVLLNGRPIYRGNNKWRSRDYRYLGTVGLFDAAYLHLNKGKNELLIAVSEDFGGWGITGKFRNSDGLKVNY